MVTEDEIKQVAKLMKIEIDGHQEFVNKVDTIIKYFDILDSAGVEDEEVVMKDLSLSSLREDKHVPYDDKLIDRVNSYKGKYVRAPKMV